MLRDRLNGATLALSTDRHCNGSTRICLLMKTMPCPFTASLPGLTRDNTFQAATRLAPALLSVLLVAFATQPTPAQAAPRLPQPATVASPGDAARYVQELLTLINEERRRQGSPPLRLDQRLVQAAQQHAEDMAFNDFFSHLGSEGTTLDSRLLAVGYSSSLAAENIAAGNATPQATVQQWLRSPGHRQNLLNPEFTDVGFGYARSRLGRFVFYWAQVLGRPAAAAVVPTTAAPTARTLLERVGSLTARSPLLPVDGSPYQAYTFRGQAGQVVTIELESADFDPYLFLLAPDGTQIAENDDISPENTNAALTVALPVTGDYRVIVNSYDANSRGRYRLLIR